MSVTGPQAARVLYPGGVTRNAERHPRPRSAWRWHQQGLRGLFPGMGARGPREGATAGAAGGNGLVVPGDAAVLGMADLFSASSVPLLEVLLEGLMLCM